MTRTSILIALTALGTIGCGAAPDQQTDVTPENATIVRTGVNIHKGVTTITQRKLTREQQLAELPPDVRKQLGLPELSPATSTPPLVLESTYSDFDDCTVTGNGFRAWDQYGFQGNELCIYDDGSDNMVPVHLNDVIRTFSWTAGVGTWYGHVLSWSTAKLPAQGSPYYWFVDFLNNGTRVDEEIPGWSWNSSGAQQWATDINVFWTIP